MKDNKLNILFLASWYPNTKYSQAGNFIQQHAKAVSKHCNVAAIHALPVAEKSKEKVTSIWNNGVYEVVVYYAKIHSSTPILSQYNKGKQQQKAYIKAYEIALAEMGSFSLVHLNVVYPAGLFALYLNKKYKLSFILTEHWTAFQKKSLNSLEKYFIKKIAKKASIICPVSENLKIAMEDFGIENIFKVVPNVVDTELFKFKIKEVQNTKTQILHISNLKDDHKNTSGILNVIKELSILRTDFCLTIAGDGDIEKYKGKATDLNIQDSLIKFEGEKTQKEVAELMNKSDFFLLFSNYETFSIVIAEAWASGLPVISSKCGGLTNEVNNKNGISVSPKNEKELLNAIIYMMDNLSIYDLHEITELTQNRYCFNKVSEQFLEVYNTVIKN